MRPTGCINVSELVVDPKRAKLCAWIGQVISAASLLPDGEFQNAPIACRRRPLKKPCRGDIRLGRIGDEEGIAWRCSRCEDHGLIINWQNSPWDLRHHLSEGMLVSLPHERARRNTEPQYASDSQQFELNVELIGGPVPLDSAVERRIRLGGECSLHQLHEFLDAIFQRQGTEPYEFMFGAPYEPDALRITGCHEHCESDQNDSLPSTLDQRDEPADFQSIDADANPRMVTLSQLNLREGQTFGYLADFVCEWVHRITVVQQTSNSAAVRFPEVVGQKGEVPRHANDTTDPILHDLRCELSGLSPLDDRLGRYEPEIAPDRERWLSLEELEALLLVVESHARQLPENHPPVQSILLHGLVHAMAETQIALGDADYCARLEYLVKSGLSRHEAIHRIGEHLMEKALHAEQPTTFAPLTDTLNSSKDLQN